MASLRKFPYPFKAMLAVSTDIDFTTPRIFRQTHRFMNTTEDTPMGTGVGLDIANSCWFYNPPERDELRYFQDLTWETETDEAEELASYLRCGWIDTMHTYGNFTGALYGRGGFEREHAVVALRLLEELGVELRVWVNHGGAGNIQNFGRADYMEGDRPDSPAYHTDLLLEYGVQFAWSHEEKEVFGHDSMLSPIELEDGQRIWGFPRQFQEIDVPDEALEVAARVFSGSGKLRDGRKWVFTWYPALLPWQLAPEKLDALAERGQCAIVAQHLGTLAGPRGHETAFDDDVVDSFKKVAEYQDKGRGLVASTSRLLEYNRTSEHLVFEASDEGEVQKIRIVKVADPVFGDFVPTLEQLRGITFSVSDRERTELRVGDDSVPERLIVRAGSEEEGDQVGIAWHEPDLTDHTAPWVERRRMKIPVGAEEAEEDGGGPRRIVVVGAERSGTTLLVNFLGLHSQVEPIYDTDFVALLLNLLGVFDFLGEEQREQRLQGFQEWVAEWGTGLPNRDTSGITMPDLPFGKANLGFTAEELNAETARLLDRLREAEGAEERFVAGKAYIDSLFDAQAERSRKRTWANKTARCVEHLPQLDRLYPSALIVHLVRDGRDVAASLLREKVVEKPQQAALRWLFQVESGLAYESEHPGRVARVSFEDLVDEPASALAGIFEAAGLPDESGRVVSEFERRVPLLRDRRFGWRTDVTPVAAPRGERVAAFEAMAPTLRLLGYDIGEREDIEPAVVSLDRLADIEQAEASERQSEADRDALREEAAVYEWAATEMRIQRSKAAKLEILKKEMPELERAAASYDAAVERLPTLRAKRNKLRRIKEEIDSLEGAAAEYDVELARLPSLRSKSHKLERVKEELPALKEAVQAYDAVVSGLPELRAKAHKYELLKEELAQLEKEAAAYDEALARKRVLTGKLTKLKQMLIPEKPKKAG